MKFVTTRPFADPDTAAHKLVEIANAAEAVQDGRIHIELVNDSFLGAGGTPAEYRAGIEHAISKGWLWRHESGSMRSSPRPGPSCLLNGMPTARRQTAPVLSVPGPPTLDVFFQR